MARLDLTLTVDLSAAREQTNAAVASVASVRDVLAACDGLPELSDNGFSYGGVLFDNTRDLLSVEPVSEPALGATKLQGFQVKPSDRYLELVSAITNDGHAHVSRVAHGWPILSVAVRTSTVTEAGEGVESFPAKG